MDRAVEAKVGKKVAFKDDIKSTNEFSKVTGLHVVKNEIRKAVDKTYTGSNKVKDKSDRQVVEKVLDKKTERMFEKWNKNGVIDKVNGCISTGKEANVYHATRPDGSELAIKIYKVETMVFRDREEYIQGEFRFRRGYQRTSPYKLIKVWAEKEYRNLKRIRATGINCPIPVLIKDNLIVMDFIGSKSKAAPRLKDVPATKEQHSEIYLQVLELVRTLWCKCKMVHGDLSPYNILFDNNQLILIDVSQSVEEDHPLALEFLKRDLRNLNHYYRQHGVMTFRLSDMFDYVRDRSAESSDSRMRIESMMAMSMAEPESEATERAFMTANIPRSLGEIADDRLEKMLDAMKGDWQLVCEVFNVDGSMLADSGKTDVDVKDDGNDNGEEEDEDGDDDGEEEDSEGEENQAKEAMEVDQEEIDQIIEINDIEEDADDRNMLENNENAFKYADVKITGPITFMTDPIEFKEDIEKTGTGAEEDEESKKGYLDPFEGMSKTERKKKVKEENKVKRQNKLPKKEKRRLIKKSKH